MLSLSAHKSEILALLLALNLVRGLIHGSLTPPWQAPDEFKHFEYLRLIQELRRDVTYEDLSPALQQEIIDSMVQHDYWRFGYALFPFDPASPPQSFEEIVEPQMAHAVHQPPLYYMLGALLLSLVPWKEVAVQLYVVRLLSVVLSTLVILVSFLVVQEVFPDDEFLMVAVPAFLVFLPMHTFITSSVTSDNLAEYLVSVLVFISLRFMRRGMSIPDMSAATVVVVLGAYTKRTALVGVPILVTAIALYLWGKDISSALSRKRLGLGAAIIGLGSVIGIVASDKIRTFLLRAWSSTTYYLLLRSNPLGSLLANPESPASAPLTSRSVSLVFESFWGRFGWLKVRLAPVWYQVLAALCIIALAGLVLFAIRMLRRPKTLARWQKKSLLLLFLSLVLGVTFVFAGAVLGQTIVPGALPQGRYLFPVIVPFAVLFMLGLRELWPRTHRGLLLICCVGGLLLLDTVSLVRYIIPYFYG